MSAGKALLVAAIDFGTSYSGWAFSFKHEYERDPCKVSAKSWTGGQIVSLKGPTCALIRPDGETIEAFGFEAESRYAELVADEEHHDWYYFQRFKMRLWEKGVDRNLSLEDAGGKKLAAKKVFALSIKYLKDDLLTMTEKRVDGILPSDIHWVLTVPAIWNDAAKQFMREATQDAGISESNLSIALEPEAASLYCRHLPIEKSGNGEMSLSSFHAGKKYLVLDAGGGTVDITVHEVGSDDNLKELHKASGGAWGGTKVDESFIDFLANLTGPDVIEKFKAECMWDYMELLRDFEVKKREIGPTKTRDVVFRIPSSIPEIVNTLKGETFKDIIKKSEHGQQMKQYMGDKLKLSAEIVKKFFETSIDSVVKHVAELLEMPVNQGVEAIVMVGGFSESTVMQGAIRTKFPDKKLIVPDEPSLAVLKGAVIFGHKPTSISIRVSKYTYGTRMYFAFDENKHPQSKKHHGRDGTLWCRDLFRKHVEAGQSLTVGETQSSRTLHALEDNQMNMRISVYATENKNPEFVTDTGCYKVGQLIVPLSGFGQDRGVTVRMIYGGTEIKVECTEDSTGKVTSDRIDFLS